MPDEVVAIPNYRRGTWVAAVVVPSRPGDRDEYVRVVSSGHSSRGQAQIDAMDGHMLRDVKRRPQGL